MLASDERRRRARLGRVLIVALALASAAPGADPPAGHAEYTYYESRTFDEVLSDSLNHRLLSVKISFAAPFTLNTIPERLDRWLCAIKDRGGKLQLSAVDPNTKGASEIASSVPFILRTIAEAIRNHRTYGHAGEYNATLIYEAQTGRVLELQMRRR